MKTNVNEINELHRSELYLYFYEDFIQEERTERECNFITDKCGLTAGDKILDLACGHGRHSISTQHGLKISEVYGHWNGSAFDSDSRRIIAVLECLV